MELHTHTRLRVVILGTLISSYLLLCDCKTLDDYEFPVYSTEICPRNQSEWNRRSSAINCTDNNGYMCIPNDDRTQLLEFCYIYPRILITKETCLYMYKSHSRVNAYNCSRFRSGCPSSVYFSSEIFKYSSCLLIGNGCFRAEPTCTSSVTTPYLQETTKTIHVETVRNDTTVASNEEKTNQTLKDNDSDNPDEISMMPILAGVLIPITIFCMLSVTYSKRYYTCTCICNRKRDIESHEKEECVPLFPETGLRKINMETNKEESQLDRAIFEQWQEDNIQFVPTRACKEVEKLIKSQNLVVVTGNSGSGKSAIIQHIALCFRSQEWTVKPIYKVSDINNVFEIADNLRKKIILVFNDPIGKESFDEISFSAWKEHEGHLEACLKETKMLISCRKYILSDQRVKGLLQDESCIVDLSSDQLKLNNKEKYNILNIYSSNINFSQYEMDKIVEIEEYFPLLCKLYFCDEKKKKMGLRFFKEPFDVCQEEVRHFRMNCTEKYCALVLLVLFNNQLCIQDIRRSKQSNDKFKLALELCGIPNTAPHKIGDTLETLRGFFVKKIGDTYHFYHDFVMEVTTFVFGTDYPEVLIEYADLGVLGRRVKLECFRGKSDNCTVYLSEKYLNILGKRLFNDIFGKRLLDVVLNPWLRNEKIIKVLTENLNDHPEKHQSLCEKIKLELETHEHALVSNDLLFSKLDFVCSVNEVSPLDVLIIFCHTILSMHCLKNLQQMRLEFKTNSFLPALCCNGSLVLFNMFMKENVKEFLNAKWSSFYPIHIASVFHNYEILFELITAGVNVNLKTDSKHYWTPLTLAAGNETDENKVFHSESTGQTKRDKTVTLLLKYGANINLCTKTGASPLYTACQNGYDSTVQLLLNGGANVNLCNKNGASPLYIACFKGHYRIVVMLLRNDANINICENNGSSPLHVACFKGHYSIVQSLLKLRANIDACNKEGATPLYTACQNGHTSTVKLLLSNLAKTNICMRNEASPLYIACENGHHSIIQCLLNNGADINLCNKNGVSPLYIACQEGHESIIQHLLSSGANVNLCNENGDSPLHIACQKGHDIIVHFLFSSGADINLCNKNGVSPLFIACQEGHDSTIQCLLTSGANVNLCNENGISPLFIACQEGHDSTKQCLLTSGANVNLCNENGVNPLFIACQEGHDSIIQHLLSSGANENLCNENGVSPLFIACQKGHDIIVHFLLRSGADINLCNENGVSPLFIACQEGHDSTIQCLLNNGANVNLCNENGVSPLFIACQEGHDSIIHILLCNEADINLCDENGTSPLHVACYEGHDSTVQLLLGYGAEIDLCEKNGLSPLHVACFNGRTEAVKNLLRNGADINLCGAFRISALHIACFNRYDSTVNILVSYGIDINTCDEHGTSPLLIACQKGYDSTVKLLLNKGADINISDENGSSPLLKVCQEGHDSTVQLLLSNGADINLCDKEGASPLLKACQEGHNSIVQLLLSNGADINLYTKHSATPLLMALAFRHCETAKTLLRSCAFSDIIDKCGLNNVFFDNDENDDRNKQILGQTDNIIDDLHDPNSYFSLVVFCQFEQVLRLSYVDI